MLPACSDNCPRSSDPAFGANNMPRPAPSTVPVSSPLTKLPPPPPSFSNRSYPSPISAPSWSGGSGGSGSSGRSATHLAYRTYPTFLPQYLPPARASSTLTAAMMPSSTLVVPSSAAMDTSEWRRLAARIPVGRLSRFANHCRQQAPAVASDVGGPLHRAAEAVQLAHELVERGFE